VTKVLQSRHAEDIGGRIVEPGQPIPDDVDADAVKRLEARGLIRDDKSKSSKSSSTKSSSKEG
jgi:hypothetical protein